MLLCHLNFCQCTFSAAFRSILEFPARIYFHKLNVTLVTKPGLLSLLFSNMSSNGPRWPLVLLSLGQVLHFVSAIEIVYPQGHTVYSAPPFGIAWTITPAERYDRDGYVDIV